MLGRILHLLTDVRVIASADPSTASLARDAWHS